MYLPDDWRGYIACGRPVLPEDRAIARTQGIDDAGRRGGESGSDIYVECATCQDGGRRAVVAELDAPKLLAVCGLQCDKATIRYRALRLRDIQYAARK